MPLYNTSVQPARFSPAVPAISTRSPVSVPDGSYRISLTNARPATAALSSLVIVPVAAAVPIVAPPVAPESVTVNDSSASTAVSP